MKNKCFDIGTIQAFLDGELASDLSERVVKHAAGCDECALLMSEAEEENAFAFAALDGEFNVLVPTERLRTKLFTAIEEIENERRVSWWQRFTENFAFLGEIDLRSPGLAAVACTLLFVGTFVVALKVFPPMPEMVSVLGPEMEVENPPDPQRVSTRNQAGDLDDGAHKQEPAVVVRAIDKRKVRRPRRFGGARIIKASGKIRAPKPNKPGPAIEGEDIYLQTISSLNEGFDESKDEVLRPKERIVFERNLAMVNNAIDKMKAEVRKNPKNGAAKELLKSSYQNKIDLLNSVSERNELMASIQ